MAKRPTRAAAGAKRPAADKKRTTKTAAAGKASSAVKAPRAAEPTDEVVPRARGTAAAAAKTKPAKTATPAAKAKPSSAKPSSAKSSSVKPSSTKTKPPASARAAKAPASRAKAAGPGKPGVAARGAKAPARTAAAKKNAKSKPDKVIPPYLAAELGQPVDHEGEPIGAGSRAAFADTELQRYTLQLWQQMQSRRGVNLHLPAMERAGVTIDQIWTTGVTDRLTTSSTADEIRRYRQKLLFRANLLESILTETVSELNRLASVEPAPARSLGEPG